MGNSYSDQTEILNIFRNTVFTSENVHTFDEEKLAKETNGSFYAYTWKTANYPKRE